MDRAEDFVLYCLRCGKLDEKCLLCSVSSTNCRPPGPSGAEYWVKGPKNSMHFGGRTLIEPHHLREKELDRLRQALLVRDITR